MSFAGILRRIQDWREARRSLRELQELQTGEDRVVLDDPDKNPVDLANASLRIGERERAIQHWRDAFARFPDHVFRSVAALRLAVDLGLYDEVDMLVRAEARKGARRRRLVRAEAEMMAIRGRH